MAVGRFHGNSLIEGVIRPDAGRPVGFAGMPAAWRIEADAGVNAESGAPSRIRYYAHRDRYSVDRRPPQSLEATDGHHFDFVA
jgi:hypothetical protein